MKHKTLGQVYTPEWIVNEILDLVGYSSETILDKYILEPSSGDGVFLQNIVDRYIYESLNKKLSVDLIVNNLEKYIVAIELDPEECQKSINKLDNLVRSKLNSDVKINWRIENANTLYVFTKYTEYFDFIVGNPPYIRIHNLDSDTKDFLKNHLIYSTGTIDIYLSFFEIGLKMLNPKGKLGFITPNSYLHNSSYSLFREYLKTKKIVHTLIDFKANKLFKGYSTYTAITILDKCYTKNWFQYKEYINNIITDINQVDFSELSKKDWSFSNINDVNFINSLNTNKNAYIKDFFDVQYGFATLRDNIFIAPAIEIDNETVKFNDFIIEKKIVKKIIKGSRYKGFKSDIEYIIFPYILQNGRYNPISEDVLVTDFPLTYKYLVHNKEELLKRDLDKGALWYEFGRSQGIQKIHKEKIVLSTLMNGKIKFFKVPEDVFVYSGIFITKNKPNSDWSLIENVLNSEEFYRFIRITGKDFSGGYKSITSKQIKEFRVSTNNINTLFNENQ